MFELGLGIFIVLSLTCACTIWFMFKILKYIKSGVIELAIHENEQAKTRVNPEPNTIDIEYTGIKVSAETIIDNIVELRPKNHSNHSDTLL